jgi:hypothetical protein
MLPDRKWMRLFGKSKSLPGEALGNCPVKTVVQLE